MSVERKNIRAVLFDKDGTLFDFASVWMPAYHDAAARVASTAGSPELEQTLLRMGGYQDEQLDPGSAFACGTTDEIVEIWASVPAIQKVENLRQLVIDIFLDHTTRPHAPVTDLSALFGRLKRDNLALGVATMDTTRSAKSQMERLGVADLLDYIAGYDAGHGVKPDPGMVHAFCARTGIPPGSTAVVGDTAVDLQMAKKAGAALAIGVLTGATPRSMLEPLADLILPSVAHLEIS